MASFKTAAATLPASDMARARGFYEGTLGLGAVEENAGGVMYQAGSGMVFLYASEFAGTNQATAATFEVDDIEATAEELRGKGVTFEEYDMPQLKTENGIADLEGDRGAWFKDPEGNIISLIQRGS
jgi:catechol 2,3-dioxygenase-like lactoylglutathione lyase family enzyme